VCDHRHAPHAMRRGRQPSGAPGPMRAHSPCGVTRVTRCLTLLLAMLAGGARAQQGPSVILGSGILYYTEAGPPVWVSGHPPLPYVITGIAASVAHADLLSRRLGGPTRGGMSQTLTFGFQWLGKRSGFVNTPPVTRRRRPLARVSPSPQT
jgi:hypothetical protein